MNLRNVCEGHCWNSWNFFFFFLIHLLYSHYYHSHNCLIINNVCRHWFIHGLLFAGPGAMVSSQGVALSLSLSLSPSRVSLPLSPSLPPSLPAAAILECWMWRGEAGTSDEKKRERGGGDRQERGKKNTEPVTTPGCTAEITDYLSTLYSFCCR